MPHKVIINKTLVQLPNLLYYNAGATVILDDETYQRLGAKVFTDGTLTDGGPFPPVQGYTVLGNEDVLNGALKQIGNSTAPIRYTCRRDDVQTDTTTVLSSGVGLYVAVPLYAGDVITRITVKNGATAATTPTHYRFALYSSAGARVAQTADQTTTAWAANTVKDITLTTSYTVTTTGTYYVGITATATTVPSLPVKVVAPAGTSAGLLAGQATLAFTAGTGLAGTLPATLPASGTRTTTVKIPYVVLH
jgi:hypothetical protein